MASIRRRKWKSGEDVKEAWLLAYRDQQGRRRFETFETKRDANARRVQIESEIAQGIHTPKAASITLERAGQLWLEHCEVEELERTTLDGYRNHVELHINLALGTVKLAQLSTPLVTAFRDKLLKGDMPDQKRRSRAMARKVMTSLKAILGDAQRRGQ